MNNPYNYTRPVTNPNMFFGRKILLNKIVQNLTTGSPCSYAIYGGRRCGKTSLMRMIEFQLTKRLDTSIVPTVIPLYMDLQFDPPSSPSDFFSRLINRLVEWQSASIGDLSPLPSIDELHPARSFADAFKELYKRAYPKIGDFVLAILIDESEHLQRPEWAYGLEDNLRAVLSNVPGVSGHLGVVMTGGVDFYNDMTKHSGGSPLRNVLDEEIILPSVGKDDILQLINEPWGAYISDNISMEVINQVGGSLFLGQFLMKHLFDLGENQISPKAVSEIALNFSNKRRDFESWADAINPDNIMVYQYLIEKPGRPTKIISKDLGKSVLDVKTSLDVLHMHGIISSKNMKYSVAGEMFLRWVSENTEFDTHKTAKQINIFISYAHEDENLIVELKKHLANLKRKGILSTWHDRKILPGDEWDRKIDDHLASSDIILLFISADFMFSTYCYDIEVKHAMERHEAGDAVVIPVILRPTDWAGTPFSKLQALPQNALPVVEWENQDRALLDIVKGIQRVIEQFG